ncbi:hypothetical protein QBC35DRAFT_478307 [Podospora australis]|uniref:Uncharacterized protein n=1 Tax=Podospora australis TaxID=1536484 RepID=A0AAN7AC79_9PEZI|nr:hypothetical protein QBC35DRAFT_478307 [Podospora australis]
MPSDLEPAADISRINARDHSEPFSLAQPLTGFQHQFTAVNMYGKDFLIVEPIANRVTPFHWSVLGRHGDVWRYIQRCALEFIPESWPEFVRTCLANAINSMTPDTWLRPTPGFIQVHAWYCMSFGREPDLPHLVHRQEDYRWMLNNCVFSDDRRWVRRGGPILWDARWYPVEERATPEQDPNLRWQPPVEMALGARVYGGICAVLETVVIDWVAPI